MKVKKYKKIKWHKSIRFELEQNVPKKEVTTYTGVVDGSKYEVIKKRNYDTNNENVKMYIDGIMVDDKSKAQAIIDRIEGIANDADPVKTKPTKKKAQEIADDLLNKV